MRELCETLDRSIWGVITAGEDRVRLREELVAAAFATVDYIQAHGKRRMADEVNRRLVILKNLLWESQHGLHRGA